MAQLETENQRATKFVADRLGLLIDLTKPQKRAIKELLEKSHDLSETGYSMFMNMFDTIIEF